MLYINNIKNIIEQKLNNDKISVNSLEKKMGVARGTIRKILTGGVRNPTVETLAALSTTFGSSLDELVFGTKNEDPMMLNDKIWDNKLMGIIFTETCYFICEKKIEPSFKKIITLMLEMYNYFLIENNNTFDKKFFDWYIKKELK